MVKTIEQLPPQSWKVPPIHIEASELVDLLEECVGDDYTITAKNGASEFESVQDMRSHLYLLEGNPRFSIKDRRESTFFTLTLSFGEIWGPAMSLRGGDNAQIILEYGRLADRIVKHLKPYKSPMRNKVVRNVGLMVGTLLFMLLVEDFVIPAAFDSFYYVVFGSGIIVFFYTFDILLKKLIPLTAVKYNSRETWWQRHKGEMVKDIILMLVGALIMWLVTKYTGTPPPPT